MAVEEKTSMADLKSNIIQVSRFIYGNWISQITYAFAELGIADALSSGPLNIDQLADYANVKSPLLKRMLRTTFELQLTTFDPATQLYHLGEMGDLLRSNHPHSLRDEARLNGADYRYQPWGNLVNILRHGPKDEYSPTMKDGSLEYLKDKPELLHTFHTALSKKSRDEDNAIIKDYDLSAFTKVMDIGCGKGSFIMKLLDHNPELKGYMFDLEATLDFDLPDKYNNRLEKMHGDFFVEVPAVADVYIIKNVIHNWPEDKMIKILQSIATAMKTTDQIDVAPSKKRLLIIEHLLPENGESKIASWMDLNFMVLVGGTESTLDEYKELGKRGGFEFESAFETSSGRNILSFALAK